VRKRLHTKAGWQGLFWTAFKRSQNAMGLLDDRRRCVEVNGALLRTVGYRRDALIGRPAWDFVKGGPQLTDAEWRDRLGRAEFFGETELVHADGTTVSVQYAAHPEVVTGRRLVLFVALDAARRGRFTRRPGRVAGGRAALSAREREVVHLVALGRTGREIADELHIAHDTVRTHVRNAPGKLGARSRAQLVAIALGEGHTARQPQDD
jgi:PAS domain S-box-containing protein